MGKNSITALFKGAAETTSGEELLQAAIEAAEDLRASIKAACEKEIQDVVTAIEQYKADAEKLLQNVRDDVDRRSGKISTLRDQRAAIAGQIQEANTRLGEAMADGTEADQDKILDEIQRLNAKLSAVDHMVETFAATPYSLGAKDKALADSLQEQAAEILDMIARGNSLISTLRSRVIGLSKEGPLSDPRLFLYGAASINLTLPVDHARLMSRALDISRLRFFQSPALTLGGVMQHLEEDDAAQEIVTSSFGRKERSAYPW